MKVFHTFRALLAITSRIEDALASLNRSLDLLVQAQQERGPATERLDALERSREIWEATCEGLLQKADGKLRAANNSEARERQLRKSYEHLLDDFAEAGLTPEAPGGSAPIEHDVAPGETEGVPPVRVGVAPNDKTLRLRRKFGV